MCPVTHLLTQVVSKPENSNDNYYHLWRQSKANYSASVVSIEICADRDL